MLSVISVRKKQLVLLAAFCCAAFPAGTRPFEQQAAAAVSSMNIRRLAGQIILSAVDGKESLPPKSRALLAEILPGGIMLFRYNVNAGPEKAQKLISEINAAVTSGGVAPFIASDQEGGSVQRFTGGASLPPPLSYWRRYSAGEDRARVLGGLEQDAERAGRELYRLGVNFNLAPLAEAFSGGNEAFLADRSYGPDPLFAGEAAAAFVRGMNRAGIASTLKHFPGSAAADPHRVRNAALGEENMEKLIVPFRSALSGSVPAAVMLSHARVKAWGDKPASLSAEAVRQLRERLAFNGIIIADDFSMAALSGAPEQSVIEALNAGVDMVLAWPATIRNIHGAIVAAVENGTLKRTRLEEAATRILAEKFRHGL